MSPESTSESIDPIALLQDRLGVDEERARDFANIAVACPVPGVGNREASLGDFMASPHGASMTTDILNLATEAQREGALPEAALSRALGFAAVRDRETGELARVNPEASKKK
jgi:hypothetical protein